MIFLNRSVQKHLGKKRSGQGVGGLLRWLARNSPGFVLLESIIAVTIFMALGTAVMVGIRTANISTVVVEEQSIAERLARNQMEYIFAQSFAGPTGSYILLDAATLPHVDFTVEPGYSVSFQLSEFVPGDDDIEKVMVTIARGSETILELETLRARPP